MVPEDEAGDARAAGDAKSRPLTAGEALGGPRGPRAGCRRHPRASQGGGAPGKRPRARSRLPPTEPGARRCRLPPQRTPRTPQRRGPGQGPHARAPRRRPGLAAPVHAPSPTYPTGLPSEARPGGPGVADPSAHTGAHAGAHARTETDTLAKGVGRGPRLTRRFKAKTLSPPRYCLRHGRSNAHIPRPPLLQDGWALVWPGRAGAAGGKAGRTSMRLRSSPTSATGPASRPQKPQP